MHLEQWRKARGATGWCYPKALPPMTSYLASAYEGQTGMWLRSRRVLQLKEVTVVVVVRSQTQPWTSVRFFVTLPMP